MDKYAVIGNPINHSLSPRIHTLFAAQTQQSLEYTAIEVLAENFFHDINQLADAGFKGLNVTVPLKGQAWETADHCDDIANRAQAVNTLVLEDDQRRCGFNTDGIGLFNDLHNNHNITLKDLRILILGAGGAVRGVLAPLLQAQPASITIANRTASKAVQLAEQFSDLGKINGCGYPALAEQQYDIIINGTSAGLSNELPPLNDTLLNAGGITYDMVYGKTPTAFVQWGLEHGASKALDGLGMLVEQAAQAFQIWRGIRPETQTVIKTLRDN